MDKLGIIITIIGGILSLIVTLIGCTWVVSDRFAKIEGEMVGFRAVMEAQNRRLDRVEGKLDVTMTDKYRAGG
jgi:hypothetical protein